MNDASRSQVDRLMASSATSDAIAIALLEAGIATLRKARAAQEHLQELPATDRQEALDARHRVLGRTDVGGRA